MVDPRVCPSKAAVELADAVRRFGPQYSSQYGHCLMPSQKRALSDIAACCTREMGGASIAATTAMRRSGATTAAGTGRAPSATQARPGSGSQSVRPSCCPANIFTSS